MDLLQSSCVGTHVGVDDCAAAMLCYGRSKLRGYGERDYSCEQCVSSYSYMYENLHSERLTESGLAPGRGSSSKRLSLFCIWLLTLGAPLHKLHFV